MEHSQCTGVEYCIYVHGERAKVFQRKVLGALQRYSTGMLTEVRVLIG